MYVTNILCMWQKFKWLKNDNRNFYVNIKAITKSLKVNLYDRSVPETFTCSKNKEWKLFTLILTCLKLSHLYSFFPFVVTSIHFVNVYNVHCKYSHMNVNALKIFEQNRVKMFVVEAMMIKVKTSH